MNIVELFRGGGGQAKTFNRVYRRHNFQCEVLNTCEWVVHAIVAYDYINTELDTRVVDFTKDVFRGKRT